MIPLNQDTKPKAVVDSITTELADIEYCETADDIQENEKFRFFKKWNQLMNKLKQA